MDDLLGSSGRLHSRRLVDRSCVSWLGITFLRRMSPFAIEPESEQNDEQSRATADCAEEAKSCGAEHTKGNCKRGHDG